MDNRTGGDLTEIDVKYVRYLMMLEKYGSISRAARALGLAQPSLSENIVRLEQRLGTNLAVRGPRGVTLTEAGRYLAREGRSLIAMSENLARNLMQFGDALQGSVSVGIPPSLSLLISVPLAETIRLETPGIKLHLSEGLTGHILDWLEDEDLDFGFVYAQPEDSQFLSVPVMEEEIFVVAAADNLPIEADENGEYWIDACDLGALPLVMPGLPHSARRAIERFAQAEGISLNVIVEMDSLYQIINMVERASAYTFLPHAPVANAVDAGRLTLIRVRNPNFRRTVYLTRKRQRSITMASLEVEKSIFSILSEMIQRYGLQARLLVDPNGHSAQDGAQRMVAAE